MAPGRSGPWEGWREVPSTPPPPPPCAPRALTAPSSCPCPGILLEPPGPHNFQAWPGSAYPNSLCREKGLCTAQALRLGVRRGPRPATGVWRQPRSVGLGEARVTPSSEVGKVGGPWGGRVLGRGHSEDSRVLPLGKGGGGQVLREAAFPSHSAQIPSMGQVCAHLQRLVPCLTWATKPEGPRWCSAWEPCPQEQPSSWSGKPQPLPGLELSLR